MDPETTVYQRNKRRETNFLYFDSQWSQNLVFLTVAVPRVSEHLTGTLTASLALLFAH